jgi:hypothetical protein
LATNVSEEYFASIFKADPEDGGSYIMLVPVYPDHNLNTYIPHEITEVT